MNLNLFDMKNFAGLFVQENCEKVQLNCWDHADLCLTLTTNQLSACYYYSKNQISNHIYRPNNQ